jgi:hypothetical protein
MQQARFTLDPQQIEFLNHYRNFGFRDKSAMVRAALACLQRLLEEERLRESADLYADVFEEDAELQELTNAAVMG